MSTVHLDKRGKVIKTEPGTQYHPDGTGPRNADGTPIVTAVVDADVGTDTTAEAAPAADADQKDAEK